MTTAPTAAQPTAEINTMELCRVGRFQSKALERGSYRFGVNGRINLASVCLCDADGCSVHEMCRIELPSNENWLTQNEKRILPVLRLLEAGRAALA